jgi:hypothetical protein
VYILDAERYVGNLFFYNDVWVYGSGDSCESMPIIEPYVMGVPVVSAVDVIDAGISQCWIQQGNAPRGAGIYVDSSSVFDVVGCCVSNCNAGFAGGGIYYANSDGRIADSEIYYNNAQDGGGIACDSLAHPDIEKNEIYNNFGNWRGGGIFCGGVGANPKIGFGNKIYQNSALKGGGIACVESSAAVIDSNRIENNGAESDGGGIFIQDAAPNIVENQIRFNAADDIDDGNGDGGGIYGAPHRWAEINVTDNVFEHNWAINGGGMAVVGGQWTIIANTLLDNLAMPGLGGGIFITSAPVPTQIAVGGDAVSDEGNSFYNNGAGTGGGAIAVEPGPAFWFPMDVTIQGNTVGEPGLGNSAGIAGGNAGFGGGIYINKPADSEDLFALIGGENDLGPLCEQSGVRTYQYGNVIQGNGRLIGPLCLHGVWIGPVAYGGGIATEDPEGSALVTIVGNLIGGDSDAKGNLATTDMAIAAIGSGGGIWCSNNGWTEIGAPEPMPGTNLQNCIQGNQADGMGASGGGMTLMSNNALTFVKSNIIGGELDSEGNKADQHGGGIYVETCSPQIGGYGDYEGNRIKKNAAEEGAGGGICCQHTADPTIEANDIINNTALGTSPATSHGGGIACLNSSDPFIYGNTVVYNEASYLGGGIYCENSSPEIGGAGVGLPNSINANRAQESGGGIACDFDSHPNILANTIEVNEALVSGGGIHCGLISGPYIWANWISSNVAGSYAGAGAGHGGGISTFFSIATIANNTITKCMADSVGGGVAIMSGVGVVLEHNTLYHNDAVITGGQAYWTDSPLSARFNIFRQYGCYDSYAICAKEVPTQFDSNDVYNDVGHPYDLVNGVHPGGTGNIEANPLFCNEFIYDLTLADNSPCLLGGGQFMGAYMASGCGDGQTKTIIVPDDYGLVQQAIDAAEQGDIVFVKAGTYTENIVVQSGIILLGELAPDGAPDATVIDGGGAGVVVDCDSVDNRTIVRGFTIRNGDVGVSCVTASPYVVLNLITSNAENGVYIAGQPAPWLEHNTIVANEGNGVYIHDSSPVLSHNIIASNDGGGVFGNLTGGLIVWTPNLRGNDVWNNTGGNYAGDMDDRTGVNGNISADPEFVDPGPVDPDYRLLVTSPCAPANSPTGLLMGAFPDESFTSLRNRDRGARNPLDGRGGVKVFAVFNNIPNPFVGTTTVSYQLPSESDVSLIVYNVAGEVVSCLVDERRGPGVYFASWDGRDSFGREVASGVYFYRFEAGNYSKTMKMLRVK